MSKPKTALVVGLVVLCAYCAGALMVYQDRASALETYEADRAEWFDQLADNLGVTQADQEAARAKTEKMYRDDPEFRSLADQVGAIIEEKYPGERPVEPNRGLVPYGLLTIVAYSAIALAVSLVTRATKSRHRLSSRG